MELIKNAYFLKSFYCLGKNYNECFDCAYCRARGKEDREFVKVPSEINPLFKDLPVAVNIFYGDPILYADDTVKYLKALEKAEHRGPVVIITKGYINTKSGLKIFDRDWKLNIHVGLSYFGNNEYDTHGTEHVIKSNLEWLAECGKDYTYNIEYRPLINGINDTEWNLVTIFGLAKKYNTSIAYSGLQVEKELEEYIKEKNLPFKPYDGFDFGMKKNVSKEIEDKLRAYSDIYEVPIFKKTSCAITYARRLDRDYNAHYYRPNEVGCPNCPRRVFCELFKRENVSQKLIKKLPESLGLKLVWKDKHQCRLHRKGLCKFPSHDCMNINGWLLQTDKVLTTSDVRVIKWLTGFTVDADFTELPYISEDWYISKGGNV